MAGELVQARGVLAIGQRLEIFFENSEEENSGYTSRVEDIVGDELVVAMPLDERHVPVIPRVGENLYVLAAGDGCHFRFFSVHRGHGRHDNIPVLRISIPEVAERYQKRGLSISAGAGLHLRGPGKCISMNLLPLKSTTFLESGRSN